MKWIALAWLASSLVSRNRSAIVERIAIAHTLIASFVVWGAFTGIWQPVGTWGKLGIANPDNETHLYGWLLWSASLITGMLWTRDHKTRFDPHDIPWFFSTHRQLSYVLAFFGIWLISYSDGPYLVPMIVTFLAFLAALQEAVHNK